MSEPTPSLAQLKQFADVLAKYYDAISDKPDIKGVNAHFRFTFDQEKTAKFFQTTLGNTYTRITSSNGAFIADITLPLNRVAEMAAAFGGKEIYERITTKPLPLASHHEPLGDNINLTFFDAEDAAAFFKTITPELRAQLYPLNNGDIQLQNFHVMFPMRRGMDIAALEKILNDRLAVLPAQGVAVANSTAQLRGIQREATQDLVDRYKTLLPSLKLNDGEIDVLTKYATARQANAEKQMAALEGANANPAYKAAWALMKSSPALHLNGNLSQAFDTDQDGRADTPAQIFAAFREVQGHTAVPLSGNNLTKDEDLPYTYALRQLLLDRVKEGHYGPEAAGELAKKPVTPVDAIPLLVKYVPDFGKIFTSPNHETNSIAAQDDLATLIQALPRTKFTGQQK